MSRLAVHFAPQRAANPASPAGSLDALLHALGVQAAELEDPEKAARLLAAARRHGLQPLLHRALLAAEARLPAPRLPALQWAELQQYVRQDAMRNLRLSGEVARLARLLQRDGITAVPYKGPAMAAALWGSPGVRQCADIDLLVLPEEVERAA